MAWETTQAFLLLYVAFSVIYRIAFDTEAEGNIYICGLCSDPTPFRRLLVSGCAGWLLYFETMIDIYFFCDVVLNLHTAYFDGVGRCFASGY